jgi:hypothetical protein
MVKQAHAHERIAHAVSTATAKQARKVTSQAMRGFWRDGARVAQQG